MTLSINTLKSNLCVSGAVSDATRMILIAGALTTVVMFVAKSIFPKLNDTYATTKKEGLATKSEVIKSNIIFAIKAGSVGMLATALLGLYVLSTKNIYNKKSFSGDVEGYLEFFGRVGHFQEGAKGETLI